MKCSDCSVVLRPVVAIDIDGTLAKYHKSLSRFVIDYFDLKPIEGKEPWDGEGDYEDYFEYITRAEYQEAKLAWRQGGGKRTMEPMRYASSFMQLLHEHGAEVWITTTRPYNRLDSVDPDTQFWLRRNNIRYDHLLYDEHKYPMLKSIVGDRVVFVLDDLPEQVDAAQGLWPGRAFQIHGDHNSTFVNRRDPQISNLFVASDIAIARIESWKREHDVNAGV